jgi:hypothetical protein
VQTRLISGLQFPGFLPSLIVGLVAEFPCCSVRLYAATERMGRSGEPGSSRPTGGNDYGHLHLAEGCVRYRVPPSATRTT